MGQKRLERLGNAAKTVESSTIQGVGGWMQQISRSFGGLLGS
ncbi:unnamed protein product [Anisakis simplex]|uniref:Phage tail tape measure protein n=1 Tax=Anisakis simplex TaxID=6269 RepID=A0A0M3JDY9_ANISI|nr:unnamed protein product [Anisakis simplex]